MYSNEGLDPNDSGLVNLQSYSNDVFSIHGFKLTSLLDDILLARFTDITDDGRSIVRNGVHIPINTVQKAWRLGEVIMVGKRCTDLKPGDFICFPNDKGIPVSNLDVKCDYYTGILKDAIFLDEKRIFGVCEQTEILNESKPAKSKKRTGGKRSRSKVSTEKS